MTRSLTVTGLGRVRGGEATTTAAHGHDPREDYNQENAEKNETTENGDADRAYHLDRVVSKFRMTISAENAEFLAGLLGSDSEEQGAA